MVKGLVFKGPRGYNMLAEVDYFYPLPDSIEALRPKRKKLKPATTTAAPTPPPPPEHIDDYDHENHLLYNPEYEHHPDVFIPQSGWRNEPNLAALRDVAVPQPGAEVPAELIAAKERIWSGQSTVRSPGEFYCKIMTFHSISSSPFASSSAVRSKTPVPVPWTTAESKLAPRTTRSMDK